MEKLNMTSNEDDEKLTFLTGNPEIDEYEKVLTDGEIVCISTISDFDVDMNGGFKHKCTVCNNGEMETDEALHHWYDIHFTCNNKNCQAKIGFSKVAQVHIYPPKKNN
tara:strand:+ start:2067 stop:2390 length:324 start_codon:yes stop_codon:yes gene_type:complete